MTDVAQIGGLRELWAQTLGDPRICIAILDGPVDLNHPSLREAAIMQINLDEVSDSGVSPHSDHGTHVTSVIFGSHHGPVKGIAPNCRGLIVPIFRYDANGALEPCSQERLAKAIRVAVRFGANVINISGGQFSTRGEASPELLAAIKECGEDVLIVAAAGNDGCDCLHVPGALPSVLAVGAMDAAGRPLPFSNWGEAYREQGILAPGERILGAAGDGGVKAQSGTSFSTPIVSGVAGLLLSLQQKLGIVPRATSIRNAILESTHGCDPQTETQCERVLAGRLNVSGSVSVITRGAKIMHNATNGPVHTNVAIPMTAESARMIPSSSDSVEASACCGGCGGTSKQFAYVIGEISYDFPSLSRFQSLQHSLAVLDSSGRQLQLQNSLDFARHLCGFTERRIEVMAGNIAKDGKVEGLPAPYDRYNGRLMFETSNGEFKAEDDGRCILIQDVRVSENDGPSMPWINNGQPVRIGYLGDTNKSKFCLQGTGYHHGTHKFDFSRASWILPRECDAQYNRVHLPHRYDASSIVWKLVRGSTNMYAVEPARSFSEDAYDELTDFLLDSIGYGRDGLDIYYYGWGDSTREWPGSWDPRFNVADCCFSSVLSDCCDNYQNTSKNAFRKFKVMPKRLARNLPRSQRVAIPGVLGGESELLNGQRLRNIVPDMRGTLSWSLAKLIELILLHQPEMQDANVARQVLEELQRKLTSLLQHFDRRVRNSGVSSADRALNYAATQLQEIFAENANELVTIELPSGERPKVKVFELDEIALPTHNQVGPPGSDCWEVEIAFFDPENTNAARVMVAQTIDVSDVVPHLVEPAKTYRRR
jgi:hypothetical protein